MVGNLKGLERGHPDRQSSKGAQGLVSEGPRYVFGRDERGKPPPGPLLRMQRAASHPRGIGSLCPPYPGDWSWSRGASPGRIS